MSAQLTIDELKPGMSLTGKVKHLELYGAFVDIGIGKDALLHISQLGKANIRNIEDELKVDQEITAYVLKVDKGSRQVALSLVKPPSVTWDSLNIGDIIEGEVVRVENFGAFVDIGAERPGMVHVSELTDGYVKSPSDVVSIGDKVQARILKINRKKRQIDLSLREPTPQVEAYTQEEDEKIPTAMELAMRKAMQDNRDDRTRRDKRKIDRSKQEDIIARTLREHSS